MNNLKCVLFSNSSYITYLHSLLKVSLLRICVKKAVVFIVIALWIVLFHILCPGNDKSLLPYVLFFIEVYPVPSVI